jgi:putative transposase
MPLAVGGVADHVHILVRFPPTLTVARLVGEVKGASSHLITHAIHPGSFFKWQGAYGAFTISKRSVSLVSAYILNQKTHHADQTIIAEFEHCNDAHNELS